MCTGLPAGITLILRLQIARCLSDVCQNVVLRVSCSTHLHSAHKSTSRGTSILLVHCTVSDDFARLLELGDYLTEPRSQKKWTLYMQRSIQIDRQSTVPRDRSSQSRSLLLDRSLVQSSKPTVHPRLLNIHGRWLICGVSPTSGSN